MLRNDIIRKSKTDRKAYELFVLLGGLYDSIDKENLNTAQVAEDNEVQVARVLRGTLITLNDVNFTFFHEIMVFIDFLDDTAVFSKRPYTDSEIVKCITNILDKMYVQFSWYKEVTGQPMTNEEIVELLNYDCDLEDFVEALANVEG